MKKLITELTKIQIKALLARAFNSGKNDVSGKCFNDAIEQTIKGLLWKEVK